MKYGMGGNTSKVPDTEQAISQYFLNDIVATQENGSIEVQQEGYSFQKGTIVPSTL